MSNTKIPNAVDTVNAIRNEASQAYRDAVPVATPRNIQDVGNPILEYQSVQNEFLTALVNKIAVTIVDQKMFENPLAFLRKGSIPLGLDVEDIYINPAKSANYEPANFQGILTPVDPDVKAAYYRRNRRDKYKVTIRNEQLTAAFVSWGALENLIAGIVNSLYTGNTIDEFNLTKSLLGGATAEAKMVQEVLALPTTSAENATVFLTRLRGIASAMSFPSSDYNAYQLVGGSSPATSWTSIDDLVILVRADVAANVDVQKLSAAFNLSYADYVARQVIVDKFDGADNMYAWIGDRGAFQIRDSLRKMTEFYNSEVMAWTYWWHCWDTFALRPWANGVSFVTEKYTT